MTCTRVTSWHLCDETTWFPASFFSFGSRVFAWRTAKKREEPYHANLSHLYCQRALTSSRCLLSFVSLTVSTRIQIQMRNDTIVLRILSRTWEVLLKSLRRASSFFFLLFLMIFFEDTWWCCWSRRDCQTPHDDYHTPFKRVSSSVMDVPFCGEKNGNCAQNCIQKCRCIVCTLSLSILTLVYWWSLDKKKRGIHYFLSRCVCLFSQGWSSPWSSRESESFFVCVSSSYPTVKTFVCCLASL